MTNSNPDVVIRNDGQQAETGLGVKEYLELLSSRAAEVFAQGSPVTYPASLAASWQLAFDRLAVDEPAALDLLRLAAQLAPEPIPFTLFTAHTDQLPEPLATAAGDPLTFAGLTRLLRRRALARVSADHLQLHRLVQAILRTCPDSATDADKMGSVALGLLRGAVPGDPWNNPATWPMWRQLLPHVLAATDTGRNLDPVSSGHVSWLLNLAATYLHTRGEPRPARPLFERACELRRRVLGEDHPDTLTSANGLADDLYRLGEYERARQLHEDTLIRRRRVLGEDHPDTLTSANGLAAGLYRLGEYERARGLDEDTLIRRRRVLGEDHPDTLISANGLAAALYRLGEYERARQLREDTLIRRRRVLGEDHPNTLTSANNLANGLRTAGEYERARQLHEDTLIRRRRVLGEDHPDTLTSANNLANGLRTAGEYERARQLDEDTLARRRRVLGEDHPKTLTSANNLVLDLRAVGEHEQARQLKDWIQSQGGP